MTHLTGMNQTKEDKKPKENNRKRLLRALISEIDEIHLKACEKTEDMLGEEKELKFVKIK